MGGWLRGLGALLLLLLLTLFPQGGPAAPIPKHTYKNVEQLQISVRPTATVQISAMTSERLQEQKTKEEKTLRDLVALLQDVAKNIPTEEPSPPVTVDTVWKKLKSTNGGVPTMVSQTPSLTNEITVAFLKPISYASQSVILPSDTTATEKTMPEDHQSVTSYTDFPTKPLASDTNTAVKTKPFDQLTNGALSSLVESLKNVKKLHETLHKSMDKLRQESNNEKNPEEHLGKPVGADILDMIDMLFKTIGHAPSAVKNDPAFHKLIEKAESFLKDALEMTGEAEKKIMQSKEKEQEKKLELETNPTQSTILLVSQETTQVTSPSESIEKKAETQNKMRKLKSLLNLLSAFSPHHLSEVDKNSLPKKAAEDITERAMTVLNAIKNIFCGSPGRRTKKMLKRLLKEDMERDWKAKKEKRIS
ncbi:hypothetical protein JRQ81_006758 [Phrynocephalus forsythii]|uniref:Sperm equatorial segment protein 1 n=1 Tax=Phrynocephalus forsythii TaxID=171643 RepID=A0A9Q0XDK7_9SAUR|nr:hypothetical protein JRQ81_006758 [Phrynocephalus forsythii]